MNLLRVSLSPDGNLSNKSWYKFIEYGFTTFPQPAIAAALFVKFAF